MTLDWNTIIIAAIASLPATIVAWRTHKAVNSRMDTILKIATEGAAAQATVDEKAAQQGREAERKRRK